MIWDKKLRITRIIIFVIACIFMGAVWGLIPDIVPQHLGSNGKTSGSAPKWSMYLTFVGLNIVMFLLSLALHKLGKYLSSRKFYDPYTNAFQKHNPSSTKFMFWIGPIAQLMVLYGTVKFFLAAMG